MFSTLSNTQSDLMKQPLADTINSNFHDLTDHLVREIEVRNNKGRGTERDIKRDS